MSPGTGINGIRSRRTQGDRRSDARGARSRRGNRVAPPRDRRKPGRAAAPARENTRGGRTPGARRATSDGASTRGGFERWLAKAGRVRDVPPDGDVQLECVPPEYELIRQRLPRQRRHLDRKSVV